MRAILAYVLAALLLVAAGGVFLKAASLDRQIAGAQRDLVAQKHDEPEAAFDEAERYYDYASRIPGVGNEAANDMRARRAALHYWAKAYGEVVPPQPEPVTTIPVDNIDLQLVVANAFYRAIIPQAKDRQQMIQALESSMTGYLTVLKNAERQEDAAFNYEYLARLRDELASNRRKVVAPPQEEQGPDGRAGAPPARPDNMGNFKIIIPLENEEIEKNDGKAGKATFMRRKG